MILIFTKKGLNKDYNIMQSQHFFSFPRGKESCESILTFA